MDAHCGTSQVSPGVLRSAVFSISGSRLFQGLTRNSKRMSNNNAGSIEDEMKLLRNKKLTERQRAAAQLRFSEKVILQKTLDAVRR